MTLYEFLSSGNTIEVDWGKTIHILPIANVGWPKILI